MAPRLVGSAPEAVDRRPRIGVVFGAGGVQGNAYHAGVVAALNEVTGFEPRTAYALVGTSAGSVQAALYGAGLPARHGLERARRGRTGAGAAAGVPTPAGADPAGYPARDDRDGDDPDVALEAPSRQRDAEAETLRELFSRARGIPRPGPAAPVLAARTVVRHGLRQPQVLASALLPEGVLSNVALGKALRRIVPFGWAPHPRTWICTVNLRTGKRVVFGRPGAPRTHLDRAVRASCAIPGVYRPVRIGTDRYIDGGVNSPSNADLLAGLDLDLAIVINPMSSLEAGAASGNLLDRNLARFRDITGRRLGRELQAVRAHGVPTLVLQPSARDLEVFTRNLMDGTPRRRILERAFETTSALLAGGADPAAVALLRSAGAAAV